MRNPNRENPLNSSIDNSFSTFEKRSLLPIAQQQCGSCAMAHTPWCLLPLDIMGPTNSVPLVKETRITNSKDWWFTITPKNYKKKVKKIKRKKKY